MESEGIGKEIIATVKMAALRDHPPSGLLADHIRARQRRRREDYRHSNVLVYPPNDMCTMASAPRKAPLTLLHAFLAPA